MHHNRKRFTLSTPVYSECFVTTSWDSRKWCLFHTFPPSQRIVDSYTHLFCAYRCLSSRYTCHRRNLISLNLLLSASPAYTLSPHRRHFLCFLCFEMVRKHIDVPRTLIDYTRFRNECQVDLLYFGTLSDIATATWSTKRQPSSDTSIF
jgi:hypothetical protein